MLSKLREIAISCWYVVEDLWQLIAPTVLAILRLLWKVSKFLYAKFVALFNNLNGKHPAGMRSAALHIVLLLLLAGGLPSCDKEKKITPPSAVTVELLPIKKTTNIKPKKAEKSYKKPKAMKSISKKPRPPKRPVKPKFIPKKPKVVKKKTIVKKPIKRKPVVKKKVNNLAQAAELDKLAKSKKPKQISTDYNPEKPMSISQIDAIRNQLVECWRILPGARGVAKIAVTVRFKLHKTGALDGVVTVTNSSQYAGNPFFKAAADNALRAVHRCSPLKGLPKDKYKQWREMEFNFDPREMYD